MDTLFCLTAQRQTGEAVKQAKRQTAEGIKQAKLSNKRSVKQAQPSHSAASNRRSRQTATAVLIEYSILSNSLRDFNITFIMLTKL
jgi:hypothetical protein